VNSFIRAATSAGYPMSLFTFSLVAATGPWSTDVIDLDILKNETVVSFSVSFRTPDVRSYCDPEANIEMLTVTSLCVCMCIYRETTSWAASPVEGKQGFEDPMLGFGISPRKVLSW
jgi:hypothetical protein